MWGGLQSPATGDACPSHSLMKRTILLGLVSSMVPWLWFFEARADPDKGWVIVDGESNTMSGSMEDVEAARALRRNGEPLIYARRGDKAWVIRDPAVVARAKG